MPATETQYPFWFPGRESAGHHPPLDRDLRVDVAVVGGGIVGLTAAHLLLAAGREVAVLEARQVGRQATGRSTAKVTSQHGRRWTAPVTVPVSM
jgi:glycine/D-amino acid oxidase-like deaminating enzyme